MLLWEGNSSYQTEQRQELNPLLSATYCSLVQTTLPVPTVCSGGSSSRQAAQGVSQEALVPRASLAMGCEGLAGVFSSWVCSVVQDSAVLFPHCNAIAQSTEPGPTFSPWLQWGTVYGAPGPVSLLGN